MAYEAGGREKKCVGWGRRDRCVGSEDVSVGKEGRGVLVREGGGGGGPVANAHYTTGDL